MNCINCDKEKEVEKDNFEVFELFVKAGADINTERTTPLGVSPLYWAVDFGSKRIIDYLLNNGADINKRNRESGMTPLVRAISHKRWDVVERLLNMGATAKQTKEQHPDHMISILSGTPLAYSLMYNNPKLVKRLLKNGASVNERYIYYRTPLTEAVRDGYPANVKVILEAGANLDAETQFGITALLVCFSSEEPINHEIAELLLKAGASTKYTPNRPTPLFRAVMKGDGKAIRILKKYGYNINERYRIGHNNIPMNIVNAQLRDLIKNGGTPLMLAAMQGKYGAAKALVELGADLEATVVTDKVSYTVKDLAKKSGNSMLINYLVKHK